MPAVALDLEDKTFVVYKIALISDLGDEVHPLKRIQIAHLKVDEAFTKVSSKYTDFADIFSPKLAAKFLEYTRINNPAIELVND